MTPPMTVPHHSEPAREAVAIDLLRELHSVVIGECPSLLNEDSGGNAALAIRIEEALSASPAPAAGGLEAVRAEVKEYAPAGGDQVMIWVNDRDTRRGGYCLECVPRHVAPVICAALASPAVTSGPTYVVNCCNCGRIIDTREESEGGDQWGHELSDDRWVCSPECLDAVTDPDAVPAATSAETQGGDGVWEVAELLSHLKLYVLEKLDPDDADALHDRMGDLTAALAPSTAAATRGEPGFPDDATPEMIAAALRVDWSNEDEEGTAHNVWHAMRAAMPPSPPAPAVESAQVKAWGDVLDERRRQVEAEGWTPAHDDEHDKGEMAGAAAVYALHDATYKPWQPPEPKGFEAVREAREEASKSLGTLKSALASMRAKNPAPPRGWPWHIDWWKPASRRRNLVKAGALILAEIERLDRASLDLATDAGG